MGQDWGVTGQESVTPQSPPSQSPGPSTMAHAFDEQADSYDKLVGANPGYHEHLRLSARRMGLRGRGLHLLDLGCGTGASTEALLGAAPGSDVVAVDASAGMLRQAKMKNWPPGVEFVHSTLSELPAKGVRGPFDAILAAYLVRNLPDPDAGLRQIFDLLEPGAPVAIHEYSVRDHVRSRIVWNLVSWSVIIPMAKIRSGDTGLYRYLWRSVRRFDGVEAFTARMAKAGFTDIRVQTMPGWQQHVVHTFLGRRPAEDAVLRDPVPTPSEGAGPRPSPRPRHTPDYTARDGGADDMGYGDATAFGDDTETPPAGSPAAS
ncbi:MAG: Methyltransferase type 11 [Pseudonocardia sp.]|jgi:ubiquinone/menaquinone biosynthesis C-methylase UbiE|nr:Methyltransferase type 11 [Pseudonocardia sp.]